MLICSLKCHLKIIRLLAFFLSSHIKCMHCKLPQLLWFCAPAYMSQPGKPFSVTINNVHISQHLCTISKDSVSLASIPHLSMQCQTKYKNPCVNIKRCGCREMMRKQGEGNSNLLTHCTPQVPFNSHPILTMFYSFIYLWISSFHFLSYPHLNI